MNKKSFYIGLSLGSNSANETGVAVMDKDFKIISLDFTGNLRRRFLDLGFSVGSKVYSAFKSPAGDPIAYIVRGTVIALRNSDAEKIKVK